MKRRPCRECPFSLDNPAKSATSEGVVLFIADVCGDDGQICHMTDDVLCEGARRFMAGEEGVYGSCSELAAARDPGTLATEFFRELERLVG